jgi:hypothetical protein
MVQALNTVGPSVLIFAFLIGTEIIEHTYKAIIKCDGRSMRLLTIPILILIC